MRQTTEGFRSRYRANIHPLYNPWLHGAFVLLFGLLAIAVFWSNVHQVQPAEWLAVPLTLLFFNFVVYRVHRHLGHQKKVTRDCSIPVTPATITVFSRRAT